MSVIESGKRAIERPAGAAILAVVGVAALVALRAAYGVVVGDDVNPVTFYGLAGGVVGALAMVGALRLFAIQGYPPSVDVWAEYVGNGNYRRATRPGMVVHVLYGAVMGATYPRLAWLALGGSAWASTTDAVLYGLGFGGVLFATASLMNTFGVFDMNKRPDQASIFLGMHLVYGAVLGVTIGVLAA